MSDRIKPDLHPDDVEMLARLRRELAGWRVTSNMKQKDVTAKGGLGDTVVSAIERGEAGPMRLANLCKYAAVFSLAVNVNVDLDVAVSSPELDSLRNLSEASPMNGAWLEAMVLSLLRHLREELEIPQQMMAAKLGLRADTLSKWELEATDPHLYRMMAYARQLGGQMILTLTPVQ